MKWWELYDVLSTVQSLERRGIFLKDFDAMDLESLYHFGKIMDNEEMMNNMMMECGMDINVNSKNYED